MNKKPTKKLHLSRETVKTLSKADLTRAVGGLAVVHSLEPYGTCYTDWNYTPCCSATCNCAA